MKRFFIFWGIIAATMVFCSCTEDDNQGQSGTASGSITGKTLFTDLYCALTHDGYVNNQYEFRFAADNILYIREGRQNPNTGEMRWDDPMRWTYSVDNSVVTIEGDYRDDHIIKMGNIIGDGVIKWEGQQSLNDNEDRAIWFKDVFRYGLTISINPQTISGPYFGWAYEGDAQMVCHYYLSNWNYSDIKFVFGKNHILWAPKEATSYAEFFYWVYNVVYPNVVVLELKDNNDYDTIANGTFMNNNQILKLQYYMNGAPSADTLFTVLHTRCAL